VLEEWLKVKALSSNPNAAKKKKQKSYHKKKFEGTNQTISSDKIPVLLKNSKKKISKCKQNVLSHRQQNSKFNIMHTVIIA
jgi:hypothetical protein